MRYNVNKYINNFFNCHNNPKLLQVPRNFHEELTRWGMECFSLLMFNKSFGFLDVTDLYSRSEAARFLDALNAAHTYMSRCESGFQVWRFVETPNSRRLFAACDTIDT